MSADESITSLSEAVAAMGALPMSAGPAPVELSAERLAEIRDRAVYLRSYGVDSDEYELELSAGTDVPVLLDGIARMRRVLSEACDQVASLESELGGASASLSAAAVRMRADAARIAELESAPLAWAERLDLKSLDNLLISLGQATEHEPMDGAIDQIHLILAGFREAVSSTDEAGCVCPPADRPHQVGRPLDGVPCPVDGPIPGAGVGPDAPEMRALRSALYGAPDALTATFVSVASLREPEGEHYDAVHHTYRVGHDLPETGGPR